MKSRSYGGTSAAVLSVAAIVFLALEIRLIRSRGPIQFRAPETTVSNGALAQLPDIPFFRFLRQVKGLLPPGATVAVLGPNVGNELSPLEDLIATGQLPLNDVVSSRAYLDRTIAPPQFVAVMLHDQSDDRYRVVAVLPSGRLYERKP
ncbi:MAG TPA: hypothetical protein VKG23_14240 [Thermoanaerobaculia bacterium]|nr:hypothetical protein [Thermoanaerobaculia bacterium]